MKSASVIRKQLRVALVDDEKSFLDRSSALLSESDDFEVVFQTLDSEDALRDIPESHLDIVVIDVSMPGINGFTLSRQLLRKQPELKIVIVSESDNQSFVTLSKDLGAAAFLPKQQFTVKALRSLARAA